MEANILMAPTNSFARRWRETRELLALNILVKGRNLVEYLRVFYRYYRNVSFAKVDLTLLFQYCIKGPFAYSKEHLQQAGAEEIYAFGETPLTTLERIAEEASLTSSDTVIELGCGRARTCFWLQKFIGCEVVGIDFVPAFIEKANRTRSICAVDRIAFRCEDILTTDLSSGTVIYLYGTSYSADFIKALIERLRDLPSGTRIITVSYPLTDYTSEPLFEVMKVFSARYTWGAADVYIQYLR